VAVVVRLDRVQPGGQVVKEGSLVKAVPVVREELAVREELVAKAVLVVRAVLEAKKAVRAARVVILSSVGLERLFVEPNAVMTRPRNAGTTHAYVPKE